MLWLFFTDTYYVQDNFSLCLFPWLVCVCQNILKIIFSSTVCSYYLLMNYLLIKGASLTLPLKSTEVTLSSAIISHYYLWMHNISHIFHNHYPRQNRSTVNWMRPNLRCQKEKAVSDCNCGESKDSTEAESQVQGIWPPWIESKKCEK